MRPPPAPAGLPSSLWVARTPTSQGLPALSPGSWCLCFLAPRGRESPEEGAVLLMCSPTMLTCWPHLHVLFRAQGGLRRAPPAHPLGCCSSPLGPAVLAAWQSGGILTTEPAHLHLPAGARPSPDPGQDPTLSARTPRSRPGPHSQHRGHPCYKDAVRAHRGQGCPEAGAWQPPLSLPSRFLPRQGRETRGLQTRARAAQAAREPGRDCSREAGTDERVTQGRRGRSGQRQRCRSCCRSKSHSDGDRQKPAFLTFLQCYASFCR